LNISAEVDALQGWVLGHKLGLSAKGGSADDGVVREFVNGLNGTIFVDEGIIGVLAGEVAWENSSVRKPSGDILHGVHANIDLVSEKSSVKLLGEEAFASELHERLIKDHIALRLHDANLDGAILIKLGVLLNEPLTSLVSLSKSQRGTTGADPQGLDLAIS